LSSDNDDLVECDKDQDLDDTEEQVEDDKGGKDKKHVKVSDAPLSKHRKY
jgi:hypothetical protein